jgi:hypothetical protein
MPQLQGINQAQAGAYTGGILTLSHAELILMATNKFNVLKQEGT